MKKIKLIFGTYNSQPSQVDEDFLENVYQKAYKPFLTALYNCSDISSSLYYSGALLKWIEKYHPEFLTVLQEMSDSKRIELLTGGYYEPAFPLLAVPDRVGQIEMMTTYIRKNFGKKPRGCWLPERVWEPSVTTSLKSCGLDFTFLDDFQFRSAGVPEENIFKPVITEDQGKIITILPVCTELTRMFLHREPQELIEFLKKHQDKEGVFTLMIDGSYLGYTGDSYGVTYDSKWLERFFTLLTQNSSWIDTILPGKYVKQIQGTLERVYFPLYCGDNMSDKPLPVASQRELARLNRHLGALGDVSHWMNRGFFRQFLIRYKDSSSLYSKMIHSSVLANQVKGDKSRKKSAREEIWKAQSHYPYWHGLHGGIYDRNLRQKTYSYLIEAEKITREKGIFKPGFSPVDFDLDGLKEFLYQGHHINAYAHLKGGTLFELDWLSTSRNYLSTVMRIEEAYHSEEDLERGFDTYERKMFHDHFFDGEITREEFATGSYRECGDFIDKIYQYVSLNREQFTLTLSARGVVTSGGLKQDVELNKKYSFKNNSVVVQYTIKNLSAYKLDTLFSSEMNLSLQYKEGGENPAVSFSDGTGGRLSDEALTASRVDSLLIQEGYTDINITMSEMADTFWTLPVETRTCVHGEMLSEYQFTSLLPQWTLQLAPGEEWNLVINFSLD